MNGRTQYGLAMCCYYEDYWSGKIKKHELTRIEKEEDRMKHVELQQANLEPVFFAYPDNDEINKIVADYVKNNKADYDFTAAPEGFGHLCHSLFKFLTINRDATVRTDNRAGRTSCAGIRISHLSHGVTFAVHLGRQMQHIAGTRSHADSATLAALLIDEDCSFNFCHKTSIYYKLLTNVRIFYGLR